MAIFNSKLLAITRGYTLVPGSLKTWKLMKPPSLIISSAKMAARNGPGMHLSSPSNAFVMAWKILWVAQPESDPRIFSVFRSEAVVSPIEIKPKESKRIQKNYKTYISKAGNLWKWMNSTYFHRVSIMVSTSIFLMSAHDLVVTTFFFFWRQG